MSGAEEDCDPEEALDEWFMESLKIYRDLHVFQLEHPTRVLEWTSGRTVCVSGYSTSAKNEILELSLPLRLLAEQNKGLCAQRDFKVVHGGFSDAAVLNLKHVPGTRCAVSSDGSSSSLQVWDLGGDQTDVIRRCGCIDAPDTATGREHGGSCLGRGRRLAAPLNPGSEPRVLHGASTSDVHLSDIRTGQRLYTLACAEPQPLSCLQFLSDGAFACCSIDGSVLVADPRSSSAAPVARHAPPPAAPLSSGLGQWSASFLRCAVVRSSASGQTAVSDLRKMDSIAAQAQLEMAGGNHGGFLNVSWAPALEHHFALSGVSGLVQVYDASLWGAELRPAHAQFEHRGHAVSSPEKNVIAECHAWHPERPRTLLSAASDASVHVWDWK